MNAPRRRKHQTPRTGVLLAFRAFSAEAFQRQSNQYTRVPSLFSRQTQKNALKHSRNSSFHALSNSPFLTVSLTTDATPIRHTQHCHCAMLRFTYHPCPPLLSAFPLRATSTHRMLGALHQNRLQSFPSQFLPTYQSLSVPIPHRQCNQSNPVITTSVYTIPRL